VAAKAEERRGPVLKERGEDGEKTQGAEEN